MSTCTHSTFADRPTPFIVEVPQQGADSREYAPQNNDAPTVEIRDVNAESPVPPDVARTVETYVNGELADAKQYSNRTPLDESGVWSLHRLVAAAYARGFSDGAFVEAERARCQSRRDRETL